MSNRIVLGISGASGVILGIRTLEALTKNKEIEVHLIVTESAKAIIGLETDWKVADVESLADVSYIQDDIGATIASGSFTTNGMIIAPCSIKTLSAVANSYGSTLIARSADVHLKEGRPLILLVRETPLHGGHLRLMHLATQVGAVIMPPIPTFYNNPVQISDMIDGIVGRALLRLGIENQLYTEWPGME